MDQVSFNAGYGAAMADAMDIIHAYVNEYVDKWTGIVGEDRAKAGGWDVLQLVCRLKEMRPISATGDTNGR
jgi:hypothetical protein